MTFVQAANSRRAGDGTRKSRSQAGFFTQEDVILSRQSQFKKGA